MAVTEMWVIYDHPSDFPNSYIARKWIMGEDMKAIFTPEFHEAITLEELREKVRQGRYRVPCSLKDDPVIIECWLDMCPSNLEPI